MFQKALGRDEIRRFDSQNFPRPVEVQVVFLLRILSRNISKTTAFQFSTHGASALSLWSDNKQIIKLKKKTKPTETL